MLYVIKIRRITFLHQDAHFHNSLLHYDKGAILKNNLFKPFLKLYQKKIQYFMNSQKVFAKQEYLKMIEKKGDYYYKKQIHCQPHYFGHYQQAELN